MSSIAVGRKIYRNSDMSQAAADAGTNPRGTVLSVDGGWFRVERADGTISYESVEWHSLYLPTF